MGVAELVILVSLPLAAGIGIGFAAGVWWSHPRRVGAVGDSLGQRR